MSAFASVSITLGVDLSDLEGRLGDASVAVLEKRAVAMRNDIQARWRGWNYQGVSKRARGRSGAAWKTKVQTTAGVRTVTVLNKARSYYGRRPYSAYVHRAGDSTPEWETVRAMLVGEHWPLLRQELTAVAVAELARGGHGPKKKVRENKQTTYKRVTFTG